MLMILKYNGRSEKNLTNKFYKKDLDSLKAWSDQWLLKIHPKKCYSITIGKKRIMITHIVLQIMEQSMI